MKKFARWFVLILFIGSGRLASAQDVLTQHNDLARTGWNPNETTLTTNNVNASNFGLAFKLPVDDKVYAQPLVVNGVNIPGVGIKNVVYVATVNNTIYAFDADALGAPYWTANFTSKPLAGSRPVSDADIHPSLCTGYYFDFAGNIGIIGTPVIDKSAGTMYFVTKIVNGTPDNHQWQDYIALDEYSYGSAEFHQYLHAIDITTGGERSGSPVEITATASGIGDGKDGSNMITFDPRRQFNRSGLALSHGIVYIAYAAHCDFNPSHGWLLGYNASTLQRQLIYNATPNDGRGGIWMSGAGPAIDENGSIYFTTGNSLNESGTSTQYHIYNSDPAVPANRGESVIKLTPNTLDNTATTFTLSSYFTPFNYMYLNDVDLDFPIQMLLIPNTNMVLTGCKDDSLYLMDRTNLGGFDRFKNNVLQTKYLGTVQGTMHSSFAYFGGTTPLIYQFSENTNLKAFPVLANSLGNATTNASLPGGGPTGPSGGYMSVSSNGSDPATGILWISHSVSGCDANSGNCSIVLRAVKASNIATELWNSTNSSVDKVGLFSKMVCPTVANGKVFEPTTSKFIAVYGLKTNTTCVTNVALGKTATASSGANPSRVTDGNTGAAWTSAASNDQNIYIDMGARYDFCRVLINWQNTNALDFAIDVSEDHVNWTNVDSVLGNTSANTDLYGSFTGRYVRMHGKTRAGVGGYSINEFQVFGQPASPCAPPSSLIVPDPTTSAATLNWSNVSGATEYLVKYKPRAISSWISRSVTTNSITLTALSCGTTYDVTVQTVCGTTAQSSVTTGGFSTASCSVVGCDLITRYFNADIGDIGVAGSVCLQSDVYTMSGSGADIGGSGDQFQFLYLSVPGDEQVAAQVLNQDQVTTSNKVGVMIRDSLTNTSRFAYLASVSNGKNIVFIYRAVPGAPAVVVPISSNVTLPYWIKVGKSGTLYAPFVSTNGSTWTQAAPAVNLNFGTDPNHAPQYGLGISSGSNSLLSTAKVGSLVVGANSTPLPIQLVNFTAQNVNDDHVLISWSTSMEQNVDHFEVQKSIDGNFYQALAQVKAAGNSETLRNYSTVDNQPIQGINYYRLEEVDSDGKTFLSPVVTVAFGQSVAIPQLQPNPASSYTNVVSKSEPILEITLYDILGKQLRKIEHTDGATTVKINTATLSAGVYIVRIKTSTGNYQQKLYKQ